MTILLINVVKDTFLRFFLILRTSVKQKRGLFVNSKIRRDDL